jgi:hypothetical protein
MELLKVSALFAITALLEIVGCYLPWLVLRQGKPMWLLLPAALALALFAWLLTLHPAAAGRTYAAYGGMYTLRCSPRRAPDAAKRPAHYTAARRRNARVVPVRTASATSSPARFCRKRVAASRSPPTP